MPLETATYISDLNASNPIGATDPLSSADDHLRLLKSVLKNSFPGVTGAVNATQGQLNNLNSLAAVSVLANATGGAAAPAALAASADGQVLARLAGVLTFSADYPRLSQNNTFTGTLQALVGNTNGLTRQRIANTSAGTAAFASVNIDNNTRDFLLEITGTGYTGASRLTGGPSGEACYIYNDGNIPISFGTNGVERFRLAGDGTLSTPNTSASEVGFKGLPRTTSAPNPGECRAISAGVTINTGLAAGQSYAFYNDSAAAVTLTKGTVTNLRIAGTAIDGSLTLAARGFAVVWANTTTDYVVSGNVA